MTKQRKEEAEQAEQVTENTQAADTVELSEEGKQMLAETESVSVKEPVIYTSAGQPSHAVQATEINISIKNIYRFKNIPKYILKTGLSQQRLHIQDMAIIPNQILLDLVYTYLNATALFLCTNQAQISLYYSN